MSIHMEINGCITTKSKCSMHRSSKDAESLFSQKPDLGLNITLLKKSKLNKTNKITKATKYNSVIPHLIMWQI